MYDTCAAIVVGMRSLLSLPYARSLDFCCPIIPSFTGFFVFTTQLGTRQIVCSQKVKQIERKMVRYHNDVLGGCSQHACCQPLHVQFVLFAIIYFFPVLKGKSPGGREGEAIFTRISWMYSLNGTKSRFHFQLLQFQLFSVKKIY